MRSKAISPLSRREAANAVRNSGDCRLPTAGVGWSCLLEALSCTRHRRDGERFRSYHSSWVAHR
ncbi:MAG: hypothetical protein ACK55I_45485 [bacterium]